MPLDPLNDPLLRAPRSHVPTIPATPEQLADFVDAIGAAGGGGGGGGGGGNATNLGVVASPTGVTVTSDTGTDGTLPLADGTNAGRVFGARHDGGGFASERQRIRGRGIFHLALHPVI